MLPVGTIRLIRRLLPQVKLIFLMRDPLARAWSHAKHNFGYREANFASRTAAFEAVPDRQWRENFAHDWPLANGDYLGQLRRWLSVFPREQLYVGFYESLARRPETLLRDLFGFLGIDPDVLDHFDLETSQRSTNRIQPRSEMANTVESGIVGNGILRRAGLLIRYGNLGVLYDRPGRIRHCPLNTRAKLRVCGHSQKRCAGKH